ncbi:cutinase gene palindrome-binding protein [Paracoccidioides lutzii Pb01]|uniref:Cutinase gene palindrome-binding protein n=1 Tax=Paracoccidioides lutzii (strain ATCC MYA-826 / Pb01) TaxID=502779 RepID=C1H882_PARBA|nr:cutinase gene palindrome-binding protein [Paracoccidioides lutzii Pb01]EEH36641.2 cutinase gene palindrome-binding protein [Paracoccidioides lutzii Pb01]
MSGYDPRLARELSAYPNELPAVELCVQGALVEGFNAVEPPHNDLDADNARYKNTYGKTFETAPLLPASSQDGPAKWEQNVSAEEVGCCIPAPASPLPANPESTSNVLDADSTQPETRMQNILAGLRDLIQILDMSGVLVAVSPCCKALIGYEPEDMIGNVLFEFIHPNDRSMVIQEFADSIHTGNPFRCYYRFKKRDGTYLLLEAHGHIDSATGLEFSIIARPYLTKQSQLLDSFLEHKLENERLTRRIAELKREGEFQLRHHEDKKQEDDQQATFAAPQAVYNSTTPSNFIPSATVGFQFGLPAVPTPNHLFTASSSSGYKPLTAPLPENNISIPFGFDGRTSLDDIELITGLNYRAGERAQGISTGDPGGTLIQTNVPPVSMFANSRDDRVRKANTERRRRSKPAETHFCTDCGTFSSPEWRKGPSGKKTLCNACGYDDGSRSLDIDDDDETTH